MAHLQISYCFNHGQDNARTFNMRFDRDSMLMQVDDQQNVPDWALLANNQCRHCPLSPADTAYCPIARNIASVVTFFSDSSSTSTSRIAVFTEDRNYWKDDVLQEGLFGIFGLIMATSGCPHMNFLRPMARFHLPFSTFEETIIRTMSIFLLSETIHPAKPGEDCSPFKKLEEHYHQVNTVNMEFIQRIRSAKQGGDAGENALVILDSFVKLIEMEFFTDFSLLKEILTDQLLGRQEMAPGSL